MPVGLHPVRTVADSAKADLPDDARHFRPCLRVPAPEAVEELGILCVRDRLHAAKFPFALCDPSAHTARLLVVERLEKPARDSHVHELAFVGIEYVDVARRDYRVESGADGGFADVLLDFRAEHDLIALVVDGALPGRLRMIAVERVFVVDEPCAELERRVALADRNRLPFPAGGTFRLTAVPVVERIDAKAIGRKAIKAEHDAAIVRARDLQDIARHGHNFVVLPPLARLRKNDCVLFRPLARLRKNDCVLFRCGTCHDLRPCAEYFLHVAGHVLRGTHDERTHPFGHVYPWQFILPNPKRRGGKGESRK